MGFIEDDDEGAERDDQASTRDDDDDVGDAETWVERTDDWMSRVQIPVSSTSGVHQVQILDVQLVDTLPHSFAAGDSRHGDDFLYELAERDDPPRCHRCTVLVFGCTDSGVPFLARVTNFMPYIYFEGARQGDAAFRRALAREARVDDGLLVLKNVQRRNCYGWVPNSLANPTSRRQFAYTKVSFPTVASMRRVLRSNVGKMHEQKVTCDTKFMDDNNLVPSGWMRVSGRVCTEQISHCPIEIECTTSDMKPLDSPEIAPMLVAYVDIETVSDEMEFPDATKIKDEVMQIGVNFWRVGWPKEKVVKVLFVTPKRCGPIDDTHVVRFDSEVEMLRGFRSMCMINANPDVMATYNGFGFDLPYLWKRAEKLGLDDFYYMDRIITRRCPASSKELSSSALGQNDLFLIDMHGRTNLDLFHWIKAREKLESYKLDFVGEHFVGQKKNDMDYKKLFRWAKGTPTQIAVVGAYCIQDCYLLVLLTMRLQIFAANVEMSRQTFTPMELLVTRGQQIKVVNQLVHYGHRMERDETGEGGYVLNTPEKFSGGPDDSYMGATVIDAKAKYYTDPIATLDFMSLYPSIILANNFCFSTLVQNPEYENLPGVDYAVIEFDGKRYVWAKNLPGVIPLTMRALLAARKAAKKLMARAAKRIEELKAQLATFEGAADSPAALVEELERVMNEKAVYNARQLALKISANSIYGFTGAVKTGMYHCLAVADCVTYRAREMLHHTVELVYELTEGSDVVYGDTDSVMVKFANVHDVEAAASIARVVADQITKRFADETGTDDIILEFEKVYWPYLLMSKKRYAGLMYEEDSEGKMVVTKLDAKGIQLVRRDNCAVAKRVQKKVLDALMYKRDPELARAELKSVLQSIVADEVDLYDYKISKSLRKDYANEDQPHLHVCSKMAARQPGSEPRPGDRVPYVLLIVPNRPRAKTFEKAEDIAYARDHPKECRIDRLYYVEHQIENSIVALLEHVVENPTKLFDWCKRELTLQQTKQRTLYDMIGVKRARVSEVTELGQSSTTSPVGAPLDAPVEMPVGAPLDAPVETPVDSCELSTAAKHAATSSMLEDAMFSVSSRNPPSRPRKFGKKR